jgi:hypothetical protein
MAFIANSGVQRTKAFAVFCASFRYSPATRLLDLSHLQAVDLLRPATGILLCRLKTTEDARADIGLVDTMEKKVYVLTGDGSVHALHHPAQL